MEMVIQQILNPVIRNAITFMKSDLITSFPGFIIRQVPSYLYSLNTYQIYLLEIPVIGPENSFDQITLIFFLFFRALFCM